jgi:prepilin-type N-terminal cleavage/methylation domain-containing protein
MRGFGTPFAGSSVNFIFSGDQMKKCNGFTLIEMLVTVIILVILLAIAIPGFSRWLPSYRLRGAARDLFSNCQLAKMTAVKNRAECAVVFDPANSRYMIILGGQGADTDRVYGTGGNDVVVKTVSFSDYGSGVNYGHANATQKVGGGGGITNDISFSGDVVVFNRSGVTNGDTGGYVYLQNNKNTSYAVGVWGSGGVALRKWNGSNWQ